MALWVIARAFPPRRNFSETVRYAGVLLAGILVPECLISLYFLVHGIWRDYFEASYGFNFFYIGQGRPSRPWADILNWHWKFIQATGPYLFSPLLVLAVWRWVTKDARWLFWPLLLVFCGDMISASLSGEFYEHYYVQTAVTVSLLLALFFDGIVSLFKQTFHAGLIKVKSIAAMGYVLLLCAVCLIPFYSAAQRFAADSRSVLEAQESDSSATAMQRSVADAIKQLTAPGDRILLLGRDPNSVYFLSGRYAGARYYHFAPLWKDKFVRCITPHHIEFFINDLTEKQPVLLLVDLRPQRGRDEQGLERWALYIPEITPYIETNYLSLEAVLDEIPEDDWFWYDNWLSILVRSDKADEVKQRFSSQ